MCYSQFFQILFFRVQGNQQKPKEEHVKPLELLHLLLGSSRFYGHHIILWFAISQCIISNYI